jgi:hypothetical protein
MRRSTKPMLTPADVAEVLGCHPYAVCLRSKEGTLPFASFRSGCRTKIPREAFLAWIEGRTDNEKAAPLA